MVKSSDMAPFLSHVHGDAVDIELELEVNPVAAFHGARRTRQAVAPEPMVGATPTASFHGRRGNLVRTILKNISISINVGQTSLHLFNYVVDKESYALHEQHYRRNG